MKTATIFKNGHSTQAIRIPKEYRLPTHEVWIEKIGVSLRITPKPDSWDDFFTSKLKISDDFSMERNQKLPQKRDELDK
jgi:antitoxin VapB